VKERKERKEMRTASNFYARLSGYDFEDDEMPD